MKSTVRTATLAFTIAALATLSSFTSTVQAASIVKPKPPVVVSPSADTHPVPNCPMGDPNGCGIYSN